MSARDTLQRRVFPRLIVTLSSVRWPARTRAAVARRLGRRGRVVLSIAFDDPYSAVAASGLADRLSRREVDLAVEPLVERGIPGDPAVEQKRAYAVIDAVRLARRDGLELARREPLRPQDVAYLAHWTAGILDDATRTTFALAALRRLWFETDAAPLGDEYRELYRAITGTEPPVGDDRSAAAAGERRIRRRGPYDTPAALIGRAWFFAHERLEAIEHHLDELGWTVRA